MGVLVSGCLFFCSHLFASACLPACRALGACLPWVPACLPALGACLPALGPCLLPALGACPPTLGACRPSMPAGLGCLSACLLCLPAFLDQTEFVVIFLFSSVGVDSVAQRTRAGSRIGYLQSVNGRISARPVPDSVRSSAAFRAKHACTSYGKDLATWRQTSRWRRAPSGGSGEGPT